MLKNTSQSKILLALDGFDEIPTRNQKNKILELLKFLRRRTNVKILVSTRQQEVELLELALGALHHQFKPIEDMESFLVSVWKGVFREQENRIKSFAQKVLKKAGNHLK